MGLDRVGVQHPLRSIDPSRMRNLATSTPRDTVAYLWHGLGLPATALEALDLPPGEPGEGFASSFKVARESRSRQSAG